MRLSIAIPEAHVSKPVLDGALEAVTRLNEDLIRKGESPTSDQLIEAGAKWAPEPPGQEHFDHGKLIAKRGEGDCDDWAPLHAATLRVTGEDPEAVAVVRKSGNNRWHAYVERSDGTRDDPSIAAGMPSRAQAWGVVGSVLPHMFEHAAVVGSYISYPELALRPVQDRHGKVESWQARADLPWHWEPQSGGHASPSDIAMVTLHRSPVSSQSVVGAARGAIALGLANDAHPEQLKRLAAIADACEGCPWEELAELYGKEHATAAGQVVGSFFGKAFKTLGRLAKKVAAPLAKSALSFIPGGGLATAALDMAGPLLKGSVKAKRHMPPEVRAQVAPAAHVPSPSQSTFAPPTQFMPYGYPVPYPVPWGGGWNQGAPARSSSARAPARPAPRASPRSSSSTASVRTSFAAHHMPGAAWPPRG